MRFVCARVRPRYWGLSVPCPYGHVFTCDGPRDHVLERVTRASNSFQVPSFQVFVRSIVSQPRKCLTF